MIKVYDFTCGTCGHTHERFVESDQRTDTCPKCGGETKRIITGCRFTLEGISGDFPTAADRWAKQHELGARRRSSDDDT